METMTEEQAAEKHGRHLLDRTTSQNCSASICGRRIFMDDFIGREEPESIVCPYCGARIKNLFYFSGSGRTEGGIEYDEF